MQKLKYVIIILILLGGYFWLQGKPLISEEVNSYCEEELLSFDSNHSGIVIAKVVGYNEWCGGGNYGGICHKTLNLTGFQREENVVQIE